METHRSGGHLNINTASYQNKLRTKDNDRKGYKESNLEEQNCSNNWSKWINKKLHYQFSDWLKVTMTYFQTLHWSTCLNWPQHIRRPDKIKRTPNPDNNTSNSTFQQSAASAKSHTEMKALHQAISIFILSRKIRCAPHIAYILGCLAGPLYRSLAVVVPVINE